MTAQDIHWAHIAPKNGWPRKWFGGNDNDARRYKDPSTWFSDIFGIDAFGEDRQTEWCNKLVTQIVDAARPNQGKGAVGKTKALALETDLFTNLKVQPAKIRRYSSDHAHIDYWCLLSNKDHAIAHVNTAVARECPNLQPGQSCTVNYHLSAFIRAKYTLQTGNASTFDPPSIDPPPLDSWHWTCRWSNADVANMYAPEANNVERRRARDGADVCHYWAYGGDAEKTCGKGELAHCETMYTSQRDSYSGWGVQGLWLMREYAQLLFEAQ